MKFTSEVVAALAVLRNAAENDFERHRLDLLERDLIAPPTVEVIDDTHQKFNGVTYGTDNSGHYVKLTSLHRAVWIYHHGELPKDYVIHHVDINPANNSIDNLQMLTKEAHIKLHNTQIPLSKTCPTCGVSFIPKNKHQIYCSCSCSAKHEIVEGKEKLCPVCGKSFIKKRPRQIYCSQNCRILHQKNYSQKTCAICGKEFTVSGKHPEKKTCSAHCAGKLACLNRGEQLATPRKCAICGKVFMPRWASSKERACSPSCGHKLAQQVRKSNSCK